MNLLEFSGRARAALESMLRLQVDKGGAREEIIDLHFHRESVPKRWEVNAMTHAMREWNGCLLTHIPVHPSQRRRYRLNVHGHTHDKRVQEQIAGVGDTGLFIDDPFYRCVSAEQVAYTQSSSQR